MNHRYRLHLNEEEMDAIAAGADCLQSEPYLRKEHPPEKVIQRKIHQALLLLGLYRRAWMGDQGQ
ncbi:MAG: hypothetical protein ACREN8_13220 [Candidatus Dormibacteraceae bacterium]